jgi:hypothetical protein
VSRKAAAAAAACTHVQLASAMQTFTFSSEADRKPHHTKKNNFDNPADWTSYKEGGLWSFFTSA